MKVITRLFTVGVLLFLFSACAGKEATIDEAFVYLDTAMPTEISQSFTIPQLDDTVFSSSEFSMSVSSNNPEVLNLNGTVTQQFSDTIVTLSITIAKGEETKTKGYDIVVKGHNTPTLTVADAVSYFNSITLDEEIEDELTLPTLPSNYTGFIVVWSSKNESIYQNATYTQPKYNTQITLTAIISKGPESDTVSLVFQVKGTHGADKTTQEAATYLSEFVPSEVDDTLVLPTLSEDYENFTITWTSSHTNIYNNLTFTKPIIDTSITITLIIEKNNQTVSQDFTILAKGLSAEERVLLAKDDLNNTSTVFRTLNLEFIESKYGVTIVYASSNQTVIALDRTINAEMVDTAVTLSYTVSSGETQDALIKAVTVVKLTELERVAKVQEVLTISADIGQKVAFLPAINSKYNATITWSSNPSGYIGNGLFRPGAFQTSVTLTAKIKVGAQEGTRDFVITVRPATQNELVANIAADINEYLSNPITKSLTVTNLNEKYLVEVVIETSNQLLVDNDGIYYQPDFDQPIDIKFIYEIGGTVYEKEGTGIRVKGPSNQVVMAETIEWLDQYMVVADLNEIDKLPDTHPDHYAIINWYSSSGIISNDGVKIITRGFTVSKDVTLYATVQYSDIRVVVTYTKSIDPFEEVTDDEFIEQYLTETFQQSADKALVLLNGQSFNVFTEYITINGYTRTGIKKPEIPQETLNERMYPGYQMPNKDNILWIVIHETDNWGLTADAASHHNYIKGLSNNPFNTTYVSWHYTVDDHSIYQHIPDWETAFHAGDGSRIGGGNKNGIGIEMAVNGAGNFELTIRNSAKLIASLLHKHNLTIANVKQHFDFSGKNCPSGIRNTNRWNEFLQLVMVEYRAQSILKDVDIVWTIGDNPYLTVWSNNLAVVSQKPTYDTFVNVSAHVTTDTMNKELNFLVRVRGQFKTISE